MEVRAWLARHLAAACVLGVASIASAQITTGTITGTVRDGQGGVIPGATVILTSETQGTKSSPVVTDATGDFVFVNLRADTYTIEVAMPSFNTLKRSGLQVSPGERVSAGPLVLEVGGATEVVDVKAEASLVQSSSAERSFTIATDSVTNLPIAGRAFTSAGGAGAGRHRHQPHRRSLLDRRRRHQHPDGRRVDDGHGQQSRDHRLERRVDRRGEGPGVELPGGVRPLERAADHGRHEERDEPVPRFGLRRGTELRLEREQQDQHPERRSENRPAAAGLGLLDRRPGRETRRHQQAVLLLHAGVRAAHRRQRRDPLSSADGARAAGRFLEIDRQPREPVSVHQEPGGRRHVLGRQPGRLLRGWRRARADSRRRSCTRPGSTSSRCTRCRTSRTLRQDSPTTSRSPGRQSPF